MASTPERTTNETIFQACMDLHNAGRQISRQVLVKVTGLRMGIVDDHVTRLVEWDKLRRVSNGIVEVVEQFPSNRKVQKTVMGDGMIEIALGGEVLEMTPSEAALIGQMLMGEATMFAQLRGDRDVSDKVAMLERQRKEDRRQMDRMIDTIARLSQQPQLAFE